MNESQVKARVEDLLARSSPQSADWDSLAPQLVQGTITVLESLYGPGSTQMKTFLETTKGAASATGGRSYGVGRVVNGTLENLKGELAAGFAGSLRQQMTGAVLTDFIGLARSVLADTTDGAKNVAAVLAAAAYEDTIRRMGRDLAGIMGRDDLNEVIEGLKKAGVLVAPQLGIAISYLKFRNDALHADWVKIARESAHSVLGFVEQLLLKHFA
jgi:hypothetical protein